MKAQQLKKYNLPTSIEEKIEKIFNGELPFEEVDDVVKHLATEDGSIIH